jgi:hypothetical protein
MLDYKTIASIMGVNGEPLKNLEQVKNIKSLEQQLKPSTG